MPKIYSVFTVYLQCYYNVVFLQFIAKTSHFQIQCYYNVNSILFYYFNVCTCGIYEYVTLHVQCTVICQSHPCDQVTALPTGLWFNRG